MLGNGLGVALQSECTKMSRFFDLFTGSGAVASFVAERVPVEVHAFDLQDFAIVLADAVIARNVAVDAKKLWPEWLARATEALPAKRVPIVDRLTWDKVETCRAWSGDLTGWPIVQAYGGHYYSPKQAVWLEALRRTVPEDEPVHTVALAALIQGASRCAASPGHTAQPFQPTRRAKKFLLDAWNRDVPEHVRQSLDVLGPQFALKKGSAQVADAEDAAKGLVAGDVAFIDPPYSGVQYSRFYHVLEAVAKGKTGVVSGAGRYPERSVRPQSKLSLKASSEESIRTILKTVADRGAKAIVTFPDHECSNGLSGELVKQIAEDYFTVRTKSVESKFSTLGGNNKTTGNGRSARQSASELILTLTPR